MTHKSIVQETPGRGPITPQNLKRDHKGAADHRGRPRGGDT